MKRWHRWICLWMLYIGISPLHAEIYRYVDASGTVRFTDNLQDVPEAQRSRTQVILETNDLKTKEPPPPRTVEKAPPASMSPTTQSPRPISEGSAETGIAEEAERLNRERDSLDREFLDLVREQAALTDQRPNVRDHEAMTRYNEQVANLNQKTDAYEAKRKAFEQKVQDFNERLRRHLDRPIEGPSQKGSSP